ncbi:uncharacterized protein A4U43_C01F28210 [Asparagus officinalis]|uniref:Leucine-rich repeat-containing N-terminal plant-type domain-containing protein n=1 Tax=Asparagus officinalis TaxID=4686 RepID=A0A5P1FVY8_ASPOF|nr:piriformospora indica-insensitive protein 2-like [Asparagus officinalis]ONK81359.1 uncharacterized protein A4U43_C01F28210 [Asparagus officinalis]
MEKTKATQQVASFLVAVLLCFDTGLCDSEMSSVVAPMEGGEKEALYSAIEGFVGDWWNGSGLYPDPCGWTPIQGVLCDFFEGLWYITGINIGPVLENSLECSQDANFTPSLFNLKHLKTLSLFDCFTSQNTTIPSVNWNKLSSSLETLELRSNPSLIGKIPVGFGQLSKLQSLVLIENSLSGEMPNELGYLGNLKRLSLEGNKFSGNIPSSLGHNLSDLLILDLSRNYLTGSLPSSLGSLTSLLKLDLSNNLLHGSLPNELGNLKKLTLFDMRSNNLSGGLSQSLQEMVSLQDLLLSDNPNIGGNLVEFKFSSLINLTNLDLSNMGLRGIIPESISKLNKLRFLALDNNYLSGSVPSKLEALPSLRALHVNANNLTGELEFSEEFYTRMGRRFASWNNPSLCYKVGKVSRENAPFGLNECRNEKDYNVNSKNKIEEENPDENSRFIASVGPSDNSVSGFWGVVLVQDLVVVFLLVLLL